MRSAVLSAIALGLALGGDWPGPMPRDAELLRYDKTCHTYQNRARFLPREGALDFVTVMAQGCTAARATLETGSVRERSAAVGFLDRLAGLRETVIAMNTERFFGKDAGPRAEPASDPGVMRLPYEVSEAGEVLIAHRMGLIAAFDTWRAEAGDIALGPAE